uniref:rhomboid-related protein 2 isoform X2 n=1 Tax=Podarcis muralis TaxID=64176 RepID=UPI0010A03201|nr:rhomboid-related protein 2 isoform X2 [Podarcis muralis]XP_028595091.1 rhomboid-related protein 2 isoform X2 [Podarcis muralis]
MELERLSAEEERAARSQEGEEEGRNRAACLSCDRLHNTVSKWMLPEDSRATYLERANCIPPPIFILGISVAEVAVFIYYAVLKPQSQWLTLDWESNQNSPFIYRPDKRKEAWRFLSYMLVHAGIEHILGNLFLQLLLGIPLELVHKGHRVGLVYIAGVLAGSLASSVCDPLQGLVGASGGVYALIGGYFMNILVLELMWDLLCTEDLFPITLRLRCSSFLQGLNPSALHAVGLWDCMIYLRPSCSLFFLSGTLCRVRMKKGLFCGSSSVAALELQITLEGS